MPIPIDSKNKSKKVEILRVGNFERRFEDDLKITSLDLQKLKQNFDSNARRQEIDGRPVVPFNFSHNTWDEAAGWITSLEIGKDSKNFEALFAEVDWTKKGAQKIKEKEFKFVSSEFAFNFKDPESGKIFDIILGGAALTNVPFIRDMEAVQLSEGKNGSRAIVSLALELSENSDSNHNQGSNMPFEDILKTLESVSEEDKKKLHDALNEETKKLSEDISKLKKDIEEGKQAKKDLKLAEDKLESWKKKASGSDELETRLKLSEEKLENTEKKLSSMVEEMVKSEKKSKFDLMLSEGKACEAQREAYMKGDFEEFAAKAEPVKLDESGQNPKGDEEADTEKKVLDKAVKLTEEKMAKDESLSFAEAMKITLSENADLGKELNK